ncbi:hypothetical protein MLD38_025479 [Melastoma candidum]|uniref:Uncharacterized protein n=1 Tax=Melastoma candidum TaxID=119954 RepID=A0ACB9NYL7_9MYRT|nr:hypothetical protein MLD38_025479 [Melastoma candidum]
MESGSSSEQEYVKVDDDVGRDDMFEDAEDELNPEARDLVPTAQTVEPAGDGVDQRQGEAISREEAGDLDSRLVQIQEEREMYARGISGLWHQIKFLKEQQLSAHANDDSTAHGHYGEELLDVNSGGEGHENSVQFMISECSEFAKLAVEERLQIEGTVQELRAALSLKDQEIEVLNAKVSELSGPLGRSVDTSEKDHQMNEVAARILDSLAPIVGGDESWSEISGENLVKIEERTALLIKQYNHTLHQIEVLQHCLAENFLFSADLSLPKGCSDVISSACNELTEAKRREVDLVKKINQVEVENSRLVEQLIKEKAVAEESNLELGQLKLELEQEKARYVSVKEKLSLAVTKGKSLVQQRDSLKQSLAEKSSELERCLAELDNKRRALDVMEQTKEELANNENLIALLQENLAQRNLMLVKLEEVFSDASLPRELQAVNIVDKCRWLADDRILLKENSVELETLKDLLTGIEISHSIPGSDYGSRIVWLRDSFLEARQLAEKLEDEIIISKEAARNGFDRLSALLSLALLEKDCLQFEVDDLLLEYNEAAKRINEVSLEKDGIIRLLLNHSNITMDYKVEDFCSLSDCSMLIERCIEKVKTQSTPDLSYGNQEYLEKILSLLYVSNLELMLHETISVEEILEDSQKLKNTSNELQSLSNDLSSIKEQKDSLQRDLERSEEKSALLREKLSMAVKKGKGLVQDREKLKQETEKKNKKIEELKSQIQVLESSFADHREQRDKAAADLGKLEEDLVASRNQRDELENTLMVKEKMLASMIESLDRINVASNIVSSEPVEKMAWLAQQLVDCQKAKEHAEVELSKVQEESENLGRSLAEAHTKLKELEDGKHDFDKVREEASEHARSLVEAKATITSLEDTLSSFRDDVFQLSEEKRALEVGIASLEEELRKATEEVSSQARLLIEANNTRKSIEDSLLQAKDEIAQLNNEKEVAYVNRTAAEEHLAKFKEEMSVLTSKLEDAYQTIKSLQYELSQTADSIAMLTEEKEEAWVDRTTAEEKLVKQNEEIVGAHQIIKSLEEALSQLKEEANRVDRSAPDEELQKFKEESNIQLSKLAEAYESIQSLGDTCSELEKKVSALSEQNYELEVSRANLEENLKKLQDEAGLKATELEDAAASVKSLQDALVKSKNDILVLTEEKEAYILENASLDSKMHSCMEELGATKGNLESKLLELTNEINEFQSILRDESLSMLITQSFRNKVEYLKDMDRIIGSLKPPFATTSGPEIMSPIEGDLSTESFPNENDRMANNEVEIVDAVGADVEHIATLFKNTIQGYQLRNRNLIYKYDGMSTLLDNGLAALSRKLEETKVDIMTTFEDVKSLRQNTEALETSKSEHEKTILLLEENVRDLISACNDAAKSLQIAFKNNIESLPPGSEEESQSAPSVIGESVGAEELRDCISGRKCSEMVGDLLSAVRNIQVMIKEFESARTAASMKIQDLERQLQEAEAASGKALKERDNVQPKISMLETEVESLHNQCDELRHKLAEFQIDYDKLKKREEELLLNNDLLMRQQEAVSDVPPFPPTLLNMINNIDVEIPWTDLSDEVDSRDGLHVHKLSYILDSFSHLRNRVVALSHDKEGLQSTIAAQILENENLKKEVQMHMEQAKGREILKNELNEASSSLTKVLGWLGNDEFEEDRNLSSLTGLFARLEKHITRMLSDIEISKAKAQELGTKLIGRQKVVDELTDKVKLLEQLLQGRSTRPEIIQDRSISEASSLPTGSEINEIEDTVIAPVPSAAHVRPMRKGSTEHLSLSIDVESDPLINRPGSDEDKGHVFKALVASGLIPRQGKLIADRIDGFWASGSRVLMNRPRARLGFIVYWLLLQTWFLITIL